MWPVGSSGLVQVPLSVIALVVRTGWGPGLAEQGNAALGEAGDVLQEQSRENFFGGLIRGAEAKCGGRGDVGPHLVRGEVEEGQLAQACASPQRENTWPSLSSVQPV